MLLSCAVYKVVTEKILSLKNGAKHPNMYNRLRIRPSRMKNLTVTNDQ